MKKKLTVILVLLAVAILYGSRQESPEYARTVMKTASMVYNSDAQALAGKHGLNILNVTWEDTGRYKGSCVGPNISDMTIQVQQKDPATGTYSLTCMPVIRYPNYSDITGDIAPEDFYLLVGNEKGKDLKKVDLREFLGNIRKYLHDKDSWAGTEKSLLAPRDSHVLVSAQACFLPIPGKGSAEFNPVLFNYQSYRENPAVLTILATREGTSVTVIDNVRDGFQAGYSWGQRLFFNQDGERASLTGERLSDFRADPKAQSVELKGGQGSDEGLNMVLLIQVPLKQKPAARDFGAGLIDCAMPMACKSECADKDSDVENAVIGHGKVEGPFTEIDDLKIERDPRFPIRVTVQFYKATSNGVVSENDMASIAGQIKKVYDKADYVGSLVTGGNTERPTEYIGDKNEPPDWWENFWKLHKYNTGQSEEDAWKMFRELFGRREG